MSTSISYDIHDNGGRPYTVTIQTNQIPRYGEDPLREIIVSVTNNNDENPTPGPLFRPCEVFVGKSPLTEMTRYTGAHGPEFDGNSILLRDNIHEFKYTYIGSKIYQFEALSAIVEYVSPIGCSDVPYPYAIDNDGNYYLMINYVIMLKAGLPRFRRAQQRREFDEYRYFYKMANITPEYNWDEDGNRLIDRNFQYIKDKFGNYIRDGYHIDEDNKDDETEQVLTLKWDYDPEDYYRFDELGYVDEHGARIKLEYDEYVDLLNRFGEFRHFKKINYTVIQSRSTHI